MENNFNGVLESISIIKKSLNNSKINLKVMYNLFLISSTLGIFSFLASKISQELFFKKSLFKEHTNITTIHIIINFIAQIIFFIYYIKIYRKEKSNSNKYYVNFLNLFGVIKFIIPFFLEVFRIIYVLNINRMSAEILTDNLESMYNSMNIISATIGILFIYISLNLLGEIVDNNFYKIFSIISLIIYMGLFIILGDISHTEFIGNNGYSTISRFYVTKYSNILGLLFFLIMPLTLKIEERKAYGNK